MSLGFKEMGLAPSFAVDIDSEACLTYEKNLNGRAFRADLAVSGEKVFAYTSSFRNIFAVIGGPPCQGFSSAGNKDGEDVRNSLIFNYLKLVELIKPRWFIFENVEGLLTSNLGNSLFDLLTQFIRLGYFVRVEKVNFASFGLPQARKRVVIVGNRVGIDFEFPSATHSYNAGKHKAKNGLPPAPSFDEGVAGLGPAVRECNALSRYANLEPRGHYDELMREGNVAGSVDLHWSAVSEANSGLYAKLKPGQTMKDLPAEYWHKSYRRRAYRRVKDGTPTERRGGAPSGLKRLVGELNALTITTAATREFIHPREHRPLTLREAARLQSFPDRFTFVGSVGDISRQIGNAFPPMVARVFAEHLRSLDGRLGTGIGRRSVSRSGRLLGYKLTESVGMSPALEQTEFLLEKLRNPQYVFHFGDTSAA